MRQRDAKEQTATVQSHLRNGDDRGGAGRPVGRQGERGVDGLVVGEPLVRRAAVRHGVLHARVLRVGVAAWRRWRRRRGHDFQRALPPLSSAPSQPRECGASFKIFILTSFTSRASRTAETHAAGSRVGPPKSQPRTGHTRRTETRRTQKPNRTLGRSQDVGGSLGRGTIVMSCPRLRFE